MFKKTIVKNNSPLSFNRSLFFKTSCCFSQQAKFFHGIKPNTSINNLINVISPTSTYAQSGGKKFNFKQQGPYFEQCIDLVNRHNKSIN